MNRSAEAIVPSSNSLQHSTSRLKKKTEKKSAFGEEDVEVSIASGLSTLGYGVAAAVTGGCHLLVQSSYWLASSLYSHRSNLDEDSFKSFTRAIPEKCGTRHSYSSYRRSVVKSTEDEEMMSFGDDEDTSLVMGPMVVNEMNVTPPEDD